MPFVINQDNYQKKIRKQFGGIPKMPTYNLVDKELSSGWSISQSIDAMMIGYYSTGAPHEISPVLKRNGTVVMSITPMERESHLIATSSATGHVVVAGLGLAMIALNLLEKKEVTRLTVLEKDETVISLFPDILKGKSEKLWKKSIESGRLKIITCDVIEPLSPDVLKQMRKVDYLWVDIWDNLGNANASAHTLNLVHQINPSACDYWGSEIDLAKQAVSYAKQYPTTADFVTVAKSSGIPLSVISMKKNVAESYCQLCLMAAKNTMAHEKMILESGAKDGQVIYS